MRASPGSSRAIKTSLSDSPRVLATPERPPLSRLAWRCHPMADNWGFHTVPATEQIFAKSGQFMSSGAAPAMAYPLR